MKPAQLILITVDVEDWFQVENFKPWISYHTWNHRELRVEANCRRLMDLFESVPGVRVRATFFVLGWVAQRLPHLVQEIGNRGHEVASHGMDHRLCNAQSRAALARDLKKSRDLLSDLSGTEVIGYRAPSFSISEETLEAIREQGYQYDASYNSFDRHGRYGRIDASRYPARGIALEIGPEFFELPLSNLEMGGRIIPMGGGGYFRLCPSWLWHRGVGEVLKRDGVYHFYIHPWEVDPDQPRVKQAALPFRLRHYVNLAQTTGRLVHFIQRWQHCRFITCRTYLEKRMETL